MNFLIIMEIVIHVLDLWFHKIIDVYVLEDIHKIKLVVDVLYNVIPINFNFKVYVLNVH